MSTSVFFAACAGLVFFPALIELLRGLSRLTAALWRRRSPQPARRRPQVELPPVGEVEASIRGALYGQDPRWQHIDVEPLQRAPRPASLRAVDPPADERGQAVGDADGDARAA